MLTDGLAEPDLTPWQVVDGRVRAQRAQPIGLGWKNYLIDGACLHAVPLNESCDWCAADIDFLKENG